MKINSIKQHVAESFRCEPSLEPNLHPCLHLLTSTAMAGGIEFHKFSQILTICAAYAILHLISGDGLGTTHSLQAQKKPQEPVWVHPHHLLSPDDNRDRGPAVPLVVHLELTGLLVIVVAPCDEALCRKLTQRVSHFTFSTGIIQTKQTYFLHRLYYTFMGMDGHICKIQCE